MKKLNREEKEVLTRYGISAGITALLFVAFFGVAFAILSINHTEVFGATQLVVHLGTEPWSEPKPAVQQTVTPKTHQYTEPTKSHPQPKNNEIPNFENFEPIPSDDFVEAEFEDLLVGTGKQAQQSQDHSKNQEVGVHYGQDSASPSESWEEWESLSETKNVSQSQLEASQLEKLEKIASNEGRINGKSETESQSKSDGGSYELSEGEEIVSLEEYRQKRKMLNGGYPSLDEIDLAGRRYINVVVKLGVDHSGIVQKVEIITSSGSSEIDNAILRALRYWKFERIDGFHYEEPLLKLFWRPEK